ncbi:hypothetical protein BVX99_02310 [bacterium F16]|nr:hypothetical protein BVX99_02310 [bacterium F16]
MPGRLLITFLICLAPAVSFCADERGNVLATRLAELRHLREVQRQEELQGRAEFRHLNRLIKQKELERADRKKANASLEQLVREKTKAVDALAAQAADLQQQDVALRASLLTLVNTLDSAQQKNPLLMDDAGRERLKTLPTAIQSRPVHEVTSQCMSLLLSMSSGVSTCQLTRGTITIGNQDLHVEKLRLGSVAMLWITRDRSRCGLGLAKQSSIIWQELPSRELAVMEKAFSIAGENQPAELLLLPLPVGGQND